MKNNENIFSDIIALAVMTGIAKYLAENEKAEKSQAEKDNAEKPCKCTEKSCKCKGNSFPETFKKKIDNETYSILPNSKKEEMLKDLDRSIYLFDEGIFSIRELSEIHDILHNVKNNLSQVK